MKKINFILGALVFAGLGVTSCSNDDDATNEVTIAGTYKLKEVNTATDTDFDKNGTAHKNQMEESSCYNDSKIVLNSDNTFTYDIKNILVNTVDGTDACSESTVSGTWAATGTGSDAVITATYEDANGDDVALRLTKDGTELTNLVTLSRYPNRNTSGGAIYTVGSVELVFRR